MSRKQPQTGGRHIRDPKSGRLSVNQKPTLAAPEPATPKPAKTKPETPEEKDPS